MKLNEIIIKEIRNIEKKFISDRRNLHQYPEVGWTEFRTASIVAKRLEKLGFNVSKGREVINSETRMGVPDKKILDEAYSKVLASGIPERELEPFKEGYTGVVGTLELGEGPTIAMRFDMDALKLNESEDLCQKSVKEGYTSREKGKMHGCGHDGHTAIGLGVAEIISKLKNHFPKGTIKLVFQPSEEGVRGAKSMLKILEGVDYILACHIMANDPYGKILCGENGFMATTKLDVTFKGKAAHAGGAPNEGKNALLAACNAVMNLHAIPRHHEGASRINVGVLEGGTDRNIIPDVAFMKIETRGKNTKIDEYNKKYAYRIIENAAAMHSVDVEINCVGEALGGKSDDELISLIKEIAIDSGHFNNIVERNDVPMGSEDFTYMMSEVQKQGGKAVFFTLGAAPENTDGVGHHTSEFDFNEKILSNSIEIFINSIIKLLKKDI